MGRLAGLAVLSLAVCLLGCGDDTIGELSGSVKVDEKAVAEGKMQFTPVDGKTKTSGCDIVNGQYRVTLPVGEMKVSISMSKEVGRKALYPGPNSPTRPLMAEALPARYNEKTELTVTVKPGPNQMHFALQGK